MTIKVVNFEILSRHYKNYQDGITKISDTKKEFIERLDPFKKEMELIITKANNGEKLTEEQEAKFQDFQNKAVEIDEDFKVAYQGIVKLPLDAKFGVYTAFVYYKKFLNKLEKTPCHKIGTTRIRVSNYTKARLFANSFVAYKLKLV